MDISTALIENVIGASETLFKHIKCVKILSIFKNKWKMEMIFFYEKLCIYCIEN